MLRINPIALSVACALSLAGCATSMQKQAGEKPPAVQPVLAVNPAASAQSLYRLGRYLEGRERYGKAIAAYREALKRDPLLVEAYTGLGMALAAQRRYPEAIREFQAAVVLAPQLPHLHNNLGYAYLLNGSYAKAVEELEQAHRLRPASATAQKNLRVARARLAGDAAAPAQAPSAPPAPQPAPGATPTLSLLQVAPRVFELRIAATYRMIDAKPLPPLPTKESPATPPRRFRLEVSNGNGVLGLAKRTAGELASRAVRVVRLTNQRPFNQPVTEVQYRKGYEAEAAALAAKLEQAPRLVASDGLVRGVDVRLVLGRDLQRQALVRSVVRSTPRSSA